MTYETERALMCAVGKLLYDRGYAACWKATGTPPRR